jgi:hypothetical protein
MGTNQKAEKLRNASQNSINRYEHLIRKKLKTLFKTVSIFFLVVEKEIET